MRILIPLLLLPLTGCVVGKLVSLPVDVASKTVDAATVSQAEADQKRGREIRKADERSGKEARERAALAERCRKGKPLPTDDCSQVPQQ